MGNSTGERRRGRHRRGAGRYWRPSLGLVDMLSVARAALRFDGVLPPDSTHRDAGSKARYTGRLPDDLVCDWMWFALVADLWQRAFLGAVLIGAALGAGLVLPSPVSILVAAVPTTVVLAHVADRLWSYRAGCRLVRQRGAPDVEFECDDEGIAVRTATASRWLSWSEFERSTRRPRYWALSRWTGEVIIAPIEGMPPDMAERFARYSRVWRLGRDCRMCGYDLRRTATSRCPECGHEGPM